MKTSGVYLIINKVNANFYVGSSNDIINRFRGHKRDLLKNKHSSEILQRAFIKYGLENFDFQIFIKCNIEDKLILEQFCLDFLNPRYNIAKNALAPMQGRKHSESALNKLRGRSAWNKGIPRTDKEKKLISINRKISAKNQSLEKRNIWIENIKKNAGNFWKGKSIPQKTKNKVRKSWLLRVKKIKCNESGIIFNSQKEASIVIGIRQGHISEHLNGLRLNVKGYTFKYV